MENFKCLPSQLDKEDNAKLMEYLYIKGIIQDEQDKAQRRKSKHPKK